MPAREWTELYGPLDEDGRPIPVDEAAADDRAARQPRRPCPPPHPLRRRQDASDRGQRRAGGRGHRLPGRDDLLLAGGGGGAMKLKVWGARGSIPAPGPETTRYGGNTSCVQVSLDDGSTLVLDAGTGIRSLGLAMKGFTGPLHILLTHLHLDHIQGLMFFAPMFEPGAEIIVWGPASPEASLLDRIARYISAPLAPDRGPRAAVPRLLPRGRDDRVGDRPGPHPRRLGHAPRPDAGLPHRVRRHVGVLPPRPRARAGRHAGRPRAGVDLRLRPRPRRDRAAARLPVHRRGVPRAHGLGPLRR